MTLQARWTISDNLRPRGRHGVGYVVGEGSVIIEGRTVNSDISEVAVIL